MQNTPMPSSGIENPYLFRGHRHDPETGFYYDRGSYMDPHAGRYIRRDAMGIWGDGTAFGNGFTYAGWNPWSTRTARDDAAVKEESHFTECSGIDVGLSPGGNYCWNVTRGSGDDDYDKSLVLSPIWSLMDDAWQTERERGTPLIPYLAGGSVDDGVIRDFNWTQLDGPFGSKVNEENPLAFSRAVKGVRGKARMTHSPADRTGREIPRSTLHPGRVREVDADGAPRRIRIAVLVFKDIRTPVPRRRPQILSPEILRCVSGCPRPTLQHVALPLPAVRRRSPQ